MKTLVTIKDVCRGTLFFQEKYEEPYNALMEVVDVEYNENAGQPIKDQWGGIVWEEPFATLNAKNTVTGEVTGYPVQSKDSVLSDWLTFVDSREEYDSLTKKVDVLCTIAVKVTVPACRTDVEIKQVVQRKLNKGEYTIELMTRCVDNRPKQNVSPLK